MADSEIFVCKQCGQEHEATSQEVGAYQCLNRKEKKLDILKEIGLEWKDIPEYEGVYSISDRGDIKSLKTGKPMKAREHNGYLAVGLYQGQKGKQFLVHRLVALAFIPTENSDLLEVNHKNCDKKDNRVSNLEWCTRQQNMGHAAREGRTKRGALHRNSKGNPELIRKIIASSKEGLDLQELKDKYNVNMKFIQDILTRSDDCNEALTQEIGSYLCPNTSKLKGKVKVLDSVSLKYLTELNGLRQPQDPNLINSKDGEEYGGTSQEETEKKLSSNRNSRGPNHEDDL